MNVTHLYCLRSPSRAWSLVLALAALSLVHLWVIGAPVAADDGRRLAAAFLVRERAMDDAYRQAVGVPASVAIEKSAELRDPETGDVLAFVFELDPQGFVVVSAETRIAPVMAYTYEGSFPWEETEENILLSMLRFDLRGRLEALAQAVVSARGTDENESLWQSYLGEQTGVPAPPIVYGPWLTTMWHQGSPYNNNCPLDSHCGGRSIVGCVATALAQILNYWRYPTSVTFEGTDSYVTSKHGLSVNAPSASFSDLSYTGGAEGEPSDADKARLCSAAGVSVRMDYCSKGSLAYTWDVAAALAGSWCPPGGVPERWGYKSADLRSCNADYSDWGSPYYVSEADFYSALARDMENARPAEMAIVGSDGGHAIVVDGWQSGLTKYHLNFGWSGSSAAYTAWYSLPSRLPARLNTVRFAVVNIAAPSAGSSPGVYAFGANRDGELGLGDTDNRLTPTQIRQFSDADAVSAVSAGGSHSLVLGFDSLGRKVVYSFGDNSFGQLGLGDTTDRYDPTEVPNLDELFILGIEAGGNHSFAIFDLFDSGCLAASGLNGSGQLGLGDTVDRLDPVFIDEPSQVWAVSAGDAHSIVLVSSGDVYAFGWNDEGQLGLGDNDDRDIPTRIPTLSGAKAIAAGRNHSLVLLESGDVYAFGRNNSGQLGLGDTTDRSTPTRITALVGAKAIAAGGEHSLVLLENGDVYTFGDNSYGQLGLGDQVGRSTPTKMPSPAGVKAIAAGWEHSLVISENRFAYAFGGNYYGQLGLGDQDDRSVPTRILLPREVRQIAAGGFHSLVVLGCLRPPTPTSVLATNGTYTAKVRVTWTGDSLATSYRVNRDTSPSGHFITQIGSPNGTFFDDTAVTPTQTYWYKVVACNDCGCGEPSTADSGYAGCAPPGPPPSVAASDGAYSAKVRVTWGAVSGATKYEIYRDPLSSGSFATKVGETATTAFDDTGVTLAQVYWYAVRACSSCGCSELSSPESGFAGCPPPPAPTTIAASDGTDPSKVHVTWASVTGATKYEVYRALTASGPFVDKTGDATTTAFDDTSVTFAQVCWYAVKACNACGCGSPSGADSGYAGEGNAYSVGSNCSGQLGLGDTANRLIPTCISALPAPVRALTASVIGVESTCEAHSLFLLENGDVYSCGVNYIGGLGLGDNTARNSPQKVGGLPEAAKCAEAGNLFSVVVLGNGDVYSFGSNFFGTLGIGSRDDKTTPVKLTGLPGPARVAACGWAHTLILLENGDVYTFGWNCNGQLGQNSKTDSWVPVKVLGLPGRAMSVGAGSFHSLVVLENGDVYGFGKNDQGQLGLGDTTDRLVPTKMQGLLGLARSVAAGGGHSLIMLENGDIDAVGLNNHGQLGRGNTDNSLVPVKVTGLPGRAIALDAAHFHSLAVLENGDVYAFGANYWGQLGLNNTTDQSTPQKVVLLPGTARAVAAGGCHSLFATGARRGSDLPAPLGLTATDGTHADRVRLTWSAVGGAASYVVQRAAGQNGTFVQIASASGTSFDDTGVTPGQLYCYRLASCDSAGCGAPSPIEMGNASTTITGTSSVFRVTPSGEVRADGGWYGAGLFLGSADIAEWVPASDALGAGTVLEADPVRPGTYRPSQCACSPWVAGVVSTQPGIVLGGTDGSTAGKTLLALSGIVPVKVTNEGGPIQPGDLLVSSSTPGYAMRWAGDGPCPCALVGKALGPMMEESGTILVLLTSH